MDSRDKTTDSNSQAVRKTQENTEHSHSEPGQWCCHVLYRTVCSARPPSELFTPKVPNENSTSVGSWSVCLSSQRSSGPSRCFTTLTRREVIIDFCCQTGKFCLRKKSTRAVFELTRPAFATVVLEGSERLSRSDGLFPFLLSFFYQRHLPISLSY